MDHVRIQRGNRGSGPPPPLSLKNHKNIGYSSSTASDPLKNIKATKPAFNVWPSSARQRFKWRFAGGPMTALFSGFCIQSLPKKSSQSWTPMKKLSGSAHVDAYWKRILNTKISWVATRETCLWGFPQSEIQTNLLSYRE